MKNKYIVDLADLKLNDLELVGGKNASLGEMIQNLKNIGIDIPSGFALTVNAYWEFINHNKLDKKIRRYIRRMKKDDLVSLKKTGLEIRQLIRNGKWPRQVKEEIRNNYTLLSQQYGQEITDVAVRSSATAEDLPDASFAGQQETYLNVRGPEQILSSVRNCFASLFTDRAISYRDNFGFDHFNVGISVCIQKMVRSDLASSGVAFSLDTESGFRDVVLINGSYGLGEMILQGTVSPDEFLIFKPTLKDGCSAIIEKKMGKKENKMIYSTDPGQLVKTVHVGNTQQDKFCITDHQALKLAKWVCIIEDYYTKLKKNWCPMDIEWAIDGLSGKLFIVQARPETIHSRRKDNSLIEYIIENTDNTTPRITGIAVGDKIGQGKIQKMYSLDGRDGSFDGSDFQKGDILVTEMTDPDWEPIMKKASAIITNKGGRTCHAAIVAREMGVPAIVGTENGTEVLFNSEEITVSCAEGDVGKVYNGIIPFRLKKTKLDNLPKTKTPIMLNIASPDLAFKFAKIPNAGVGLVREEFIINNYIQAHPLALLKHKRLKDEKLTEKIRILTRGFKNEETFFVKRLSYGIAKIASAFFPKTTIVRLSDFKSNEYYNLLGGEYFEPNEENPMIGWRGASRYYSDKYEYAFGMECKAIKRVREKMGLKNVTIMIPFCRTVKELKKVYKVMKKYGLQRGKDGLQVYLMAELPSNIIMAEEFAQHIDGFSIGSNDLTQLTLGLDRDSSLVAHIYDERNEAVKYSISNLIKAAKKTKTKVGICGQGPSDYPDFAQFLVEEGINTISVTPDSMLKTIIAINKIETKKK
ncbi:MAG: phosphoenolpyruvate synthase [Bacteroidota bacterium]|nr:phosphoenolpyruvate synthase [Bacteroidota bacterium]